MVDQHFDGMIRNLYKVFGLDAAIHVETVKSGLTKTELMELFDHALDLKDINLEMPAGCIQVIMWLSGSGKSMLIRHINRFIDPMAGEVLVNGVDVVKINQADLREFRRLQTAMVFQTFALLPYRKVIENTVYGLEVQGVSRSKSIKAAMQWIERDGLKGFENKYPNQLSEGMQQRVGLARALANDAPVLMKDEAYFALDPLIQMDIQAVLLDLQKEIKKTIVFITHDLDETLRFGDQIAFLRDGEVTQQGTSQDIILRPADEYVAKFIREVKRSSAPRRSRYDVIALQRALERDDYRSGYHRRRGCAYAVVGAGWRSHGGSAIRETLGRCYVPPACGGHGQCARGADSERSYPCTSPLTLRTPQQLP